MHIPAITLTWSSTCDYYYYNTFLKVFFIDIHCDDSIIYQMLLWTTQSYTKIICRPPNWAEPPVYPIYGSTTVELLHGTIQDRNT